MTLAPCWLSVVTVVKDDSTGMSRTLASLASQKCSGVELVIIDGSEDLSEIPDTCSAAGLPPDLDVAYLHQPPAGIYPAMNAGLASARGDYVLFLNAGDTFDQSHVIEDLAALVLPNRPAWLVGRVRISGPSGTTLSATWDFEEERRHYFARGLFPPHQATIAQRMLLTAAGGFDVTYSIAADYALALRLSTMTAPYMTDYVIAHFAEGGVSTQRWQDSFREFHRARCEILRPTGPGALQERWATAVHFTRVFAYRSVWMRLRGAVT